MLASLARSKRRSNGRAYAWILGWAIASVLAQYWNASFKLSEALTAPAWKQPFGTDVFGRNTLLLTLKASGSSLMVALVAVFMIYLSGFLLCLLITTLSKPLQFWAKRVLEFFLALPSVLLALSLAVVRGPGWTTLALSILVGSLPGFLRLLIARSEELLKTDYVRASRSVGASPLFTYCTHVFPGVLSLASVKLPNLLAGALMTEASLSFVGIGAPIGEETWGLLLAQGRDYLIEAPHIAMVTGIPLILTILALQELSEGLFQSLPNRDRISR